QSATVYSICVNPNRIYQQQQKEAKSDDPIVGTPESERMLDAAAKILSEEMENACKMKVRLRADVNTGKTWYDAKG
ncbi:MAG: hypothetical protein IIV47_03445, partial [Clostridia bacterium]|nr:hypothetical protein [Clostridia bacterium]